MATTEAELAGLVARMRATTARSPDAWGDVDLTFTQLRALFVLAAAQHSVRVSDLAKSLHMSLASASALSDRLVRLGYIGRREDPSDRRRYALRRMSQHERDALATSLRAFVRVLSPKARSSTRTVIKRSS